MHKAPKNSHKNPLVKGFLFKHYTFLSVIREKTMDSTSIKQTLKCLTAKYLS